MASEKKLEEKKKEVAIVSQKLREAGSIILANYRGLTVDQDTRMRSDLRKAGVHYIVVKNSILKHAIQGTGFEKLEAYLTGPTAVATSDDQVLAAKMLVKATKDFKMLEIKAGVVDGSLIDSPGVLILANLPSREELIANMLGCMKRPITGLVIVLKANIRSLSVVLQAIADQKQNKSA